MLNEGVVVLTAAKVLRLVWGRGCGDGGASTESVDCRRSDPRLKGRIGSDEGGVMRYRLCRRLCHVIGATAGPCSLAFLHPLHEPCGLTSAGSAVAATSARL